MKIKKLILLTLILSLVLALVACGSADSSNSSNGSNTNIGSNSNNGSNTNGTPVSPYYPATPTAAFCSICGGAGYTECLQCDGDGWMESSGYVPGYAGGGGQSYNEKKPCTNPLCNGGKKDCPLCP